MSKSKFPNQIDSSIEIPAVRDNIIEVGSDVINRLRSAIFQIEKTLGINPQGSAGNTVSKRLDKALDGNGNILKEALDRANLLSGPITDSNVSSVAAIAESKLKLDFPTNLLQDEISILDKQLESIILQIEGLSAKLSAHIHHDGINRHKAKAISVEKIDKIDSPNSIDSTKGGTVQEVFEEIFSSHINYDGKNTDSDKNSHSAKQIFFDNTNVIDKVKSLNTQDAIEEILSADIGGIRDHQNLFHSNGLLRSTDEMGWTKTGEQLPIIGPVSITFSGSAAANSARFFNIFFEDAIDISNLEILKSDILEIDDIDFNFRFQIYETILDNDLLSGLVVFGNLNIDSTVGTVGKIYKNRSQPAQLSSLLIGVRPDINHTSAETIQIADPRSTSIITYGLRPFEINSENRFITLKIDGGDEILIDLYDKSLDSQSIDSIVNRVNIQLLSSAHPALAYRVEMPYGGVEMAIVHNIPSSPDKDYSLKVEKGSDNAIVSSGFEYIKGVEVYSRSGSYFYINGMTKFGLNRSMSRSDLFATDGTTFIESIDVSLLNNNVLKNNLINVFKENSVETYKIASLSDLQITTDINQMPDGFSESDSISKFEIYENTISFENETFSEINSNFASGIFDIFIDSSGHLISNKRLSYESNYSPAATSSISIVDFHGMATETKYLYAKIIDIDTIEMSLGSGRPFRFKRLATGGFYRELYDGLFSIKVYVEKFSSLYSYINDSNNIPDNGSITIAMNIFSDVNREENFHIGRIHYESGIGRVSGAGSNMPRVISSINRGTTGFKDISSNAIYKLSNEPISELRTSGVVIGLKVEKASDGDQLSDGLFKLDVSDGICYIAGKRMEISGGSNIVTNIDSAIIDKFYVAINHLGEFVFSPTDSVTCGCLLDISSHCILGAVEWDNVSSSFVDLRLFIDNLDLKLLNSITVSPEPGMGHFDNLPDALQYAKRFSEIFTKAGTPTIQMKSGRHYIEIDTGVPLLSQGGANLALLEPGFVASKIFEAGLVINFPVKIVGEGESTILDIRFAFADDEGDVRSEPEETGFRPQAQVGVLMISGDGILDSLKTIMGGETLVEGLVEISNLKLNQCKIMSHGINTEKTIDNNLYILNCGLRLSNIIFDYTENKPNLGPVSLGLIQNGIGIEIGSDDHLQVEKIGNLSVDSCTFLNCSIRFNLLDVTKYKNISLTNNRVSGFGLKMNTKYVRGLIDAADPFGSIIDPRMTDYGKNNINILGNIHESGGNKIDASIAPGGQARPRDRGWLDRINRTLIVGDNIGIKEGWPEHELVIKGGPNDAPPIIEMKTSDIAGEESKIIFTKDSMNGQTVVVGKIGFEDDGGGMFMRSGDGQTGITINSLGVQTSERLYANAGFTIFREAPKTFLSNETDFRGQTRITGNGSSLSIDCDGGTRFALNHIATIGNDATMEPLGVLMSGPGGTSTAVGIHPTGLSSRSIKRDIVDLDIGLDEVNKMRPVSYVLKYDESERINIGMIVEELADLDNRMVIMGPKVTVEDGKINRDHNIESPVPYKWQAREIVPVLVRAIQELSQKVKDLEEKSNA